MKKQLMAVMSSVLPVAEAGEQVRDRVLLAIYGSFSNAKKDPRNAHRKLVTCPFVLGKRETRRLMGDHVFCEQPHYGRYWIPYRSLYSRNVPNLFMAGRCFSCTHVAKGARATYPLPVKAAGRYRLKGLVPHLFNYSFAPVVRLTVKSGERSTELTWNQLAGSGEWQDLSVVDLVPGATLTVSEGPMQDPVYGSAWVGAYAADGFAIVQEAGK